MSDVEKKYTNGVVTIVWKPAVCIHSTLCWNNTMGLPEVFNPRIKPWIKPENSSTEKIVEHVNNCPSGALSFYYNNESPQPVETSHDNVIETIPNGPLMIYGNLVVKDTNGNELHKGKVTAFCRCGASNNKPYCDGSHVKIDFKG